MKSFKQYMEESRAWSRYTKDISYLHIGHLFPETSEWKYNYDPSKGLDSGKDLDIWYERNGRVIVLPNGKFEGHSEIYFTKMSKSMMSGRIDHKKKMISLSTNVGGRRSSDADIFSIAFDLQKMYKGYEIIKFGERRGENEVFNLNESMRGILSESAWDRYTGPYDDYLKVGHYTTSGKKPNELWRKQGRHIKYKDVVNAKDTHNKIFGSVGGRSYHQGRVDHGRKVVSYSPDPSASEADVFDVAYDLKKAFKGYKIIRYGGWRDVQILKEDTTPLNEAKFWAPPKMYPGKSTYISIGHSGWDKIDLDDVVLWMATEKRIMYKTPKHGGDTHDMHWSMGRQTVAFGRIVHSEKLISFEINGMYGDDSAEIFSIAHDLQKKYRGYDILRNVGNHWARFIG